MKITNFLLILIAAGIMTSLFSCKENNNFIADLQEADFIKKAAKYISYDQDYSTRVNGVYKLSLNGSQAFSADYWNWNYPTPFLNNDPSWIYPAPFLENNDETISVIKIMSDPLPENSHQFTANQPFADGVFPTKQASTGIIRPIPLSARTIQTYNTSGDEITNAYPPTYNVYYDNMTGKLDKTVETVFDATGGHLSLMIKTFLEDPREYSDYYLSGFSYRTGINDDFIGSTTTLIEADATGGNYKETYTYRNFDATGALGDFSMNSFGTENGFNIAKKITIKTHFTEASGDIPANTIIEETLKYTSGDVPVFKEMATYSYQDFPLRKLSGYQFSSYNVTGDTLTLTTLQEKDYTDGFETTERVYSISNGVSLLTSTKEYARDTQGRISGLEIKNDQGIPLYREIYTFDSSNRTDTVRSHDVDASTDLNSCNATKNIDYIYETIPTATQDFKRISKIYYACKADNSAINADQPLSKGSITYNEMGLPTLVQTFTWFAGNYVLNTQTGVEYNSTGAKTKLQNYSVTSGIATPSSYTLYEYDTRHFLTSTKNYDASGDFSSNFDVTTYTYK
ncbi:MAG: hypothetical protein OEY59_07475 [Deltaproteobacteria bacterium]|nr:hypothetical protein [Deltaproteobacteria bacterium]